MHLIDITNSYSDLVQNQLNATDATYIKVYSLGNTTVVYTEGKNTIEIVLENHDRRIRGEELQFVVDHLVKDKDTSYTLTVDPKRKVMEININK